MRRGESIASAKFSGDAAQACYNLDSRCAPAKLPFGMLADRYPIKPIVLIGGSVIAAASLVCAVIDS